jgi:HD superfamily phosphohydrolase
MIIYYDSLYGKIEMEDLVFDLVSKCPELKRLKYVGMMNFKSIGMLPLTSITRLEHTLGLAYLTQLFSAANGLSQYKNDLLVSALYHDINCGSFGHSIEWAIDRYTPYNHEKKTKWLVDKEKLSSLDIKPIFIEQPGLGRYNFNKKYKLDFDRIQHFIEGRELFVINNKGIDLDNIDNVFRMGLYLGIISNHVEVPVMLAQNLRVSADYDNFIIDKDFLKYVNVWHDLRADIYHKFIYNPEYMAFEYLLFELISKYTKHIEKEGLGNLFHFSDEQLLWYFYERKDVPELNSIARKLLLHEIPITYSIIRSKNFNYKGDIINTKILETLTHEVPNDLVSSQKLSKEIMGNIYYHLTTDNRKTERQVVIYIEDKGVIRREVIGDDTQYILIAILGRLPLSNKAISILTDKTIEILGMQGYKGFERVDFADYASAQKEFLF